jgi:glycosyltransferase involved in cell wall biosynthesis
MNIGYITQGYPVKSQTWIPLEIQELEKRGHKITIIDWSKPITSEKYNKAKQCEFLIAHWSYSGKVIQRWGIPFGLICHAYDIFKDNGSTLKEVSMYPNCKFVGCITEYHRTKYKEWGIDKPLLDTPVCCDVEGLYKKKEYLGDNIVTGGRNKEKKGFKYAVEGFPRIHLFGSQSLDDYKSISKLVTTHGWLPKEQLRELLDECWLFVSPNVKDSEGDSDGQCTTIKEALLMELQVLTTDIAGNSEYKHVYFSNPQDIAKGYNGEVYRQIIKERNTKGRQYVLDTFSPKVCISKYLEAIESVC